MADDNTNKPAPVLVDNWKSLWRAWSMRIAALGLVLPELLQFIADNTDSIPSLSPEKKNLIRVVALALVIVLRPIRQTALATPPNPPTT